MAPIRRPVWSERVKRAAAIEKGRSAAGIGREHHLETHAVLRTLARTSRHKSTRCSQVFRGGARERARHVASVHHAKQRARVASFCASRPGGALYFSLFGDFQGIVNFYAEVPHGRLQLSVAK